MPQSVRLEWHADGPITPFRSLVMSAFIPELETVVPQLLERHNASVKALADKKNVVILFPAGTTKQEFFPRMSTLRYQITFPDGYTITQIIIPAKGQEPSQVNIALNKSDLSQEFWDAHPELLKIL